MMSIPSFLTGLKILLHCINTAILHASDIVAGRPATFPVTGSTTSVSLVDFLLGGVHIPCNRVTDWRDVQHASYFNNAVITLLYIPGTEII